VDNPCCDAQRPETSPAVDVLPSQPARALVVIVEWRAPLLDALDSRHRDADHSVSDVDRDHRLRLLDDPAGEHACTLEIDFVGKGERRYEEQEPGSLSQSKPLGRTRI